MHGQAGEIGFEIDSVYKTHLCLSQYHSDITSGDNINMKHLSMTETADGSHAWTGRIKGWNSDLEYVIIQKSYQHCASLANS